MIPVSEWIEQHLNLIRSGGTVLDLACGSGRHTRLALDNNFYVTALDRHTDLVSNLLPHERLEVVTADLEDGSPWPLSNCYDGIIVCNYLHRPVFDHLVSSLSPGGILIYETFMVGNEEFGRPARAEFLLEADELRVVFGKSCEILASWQGKVELPSAAMRQRIVARKRN